VIMLSPGPGIPEEAGILKEVIRTYAGIKPIFGVCLGLQAITEVFGGTIINLENVFHGVATKMKVMDKEAVIFKEVPETFLAARYHSWAATDENFPEEIQVTARDEDGLIQAIQHKIFPISAVQFHPESILTDVGEQLLRNFINSIKKESN
jgi:anthranilate synthase component 2